MEETCVSVLTVVKCSYMQLCYLNCFTIMITFVYFPFTAHCTHFNNPTCWCWYSQAVCHWSLCLNYIIGLRLRDCYINDFSYCQLVLTFLFISSTVCTRFIHIVSQGMRCWYWSIFVCLNTSINKWGNVFFFKLSLSPTRPIFTSLLYLHVTSVAKKKKKVFETKSLYSIKSKMHISLCVFIRDARYEIFKPITITDD